MEELKEKLVRVAIAGNNTVMCGRFSGDMIHIASEFMRLCEDIVAEYGPEEDNGEKDA